MCTWLKKQTWLGTLAAFVTMLLFIVLLSILIENKTVMPCLAPWYLHGIATMIGSGIALWGHRTKHFQRVAAVTVSYLAGIWILSITAKGSLLCDKRVMLSMAASVVGGIVANALAARKGIKKREGRSKYHTANRRKRVVT